MLLGLSGTENGTAVDVGSIVASSDEDGGVAHGAILRRFAEAVHNRSAELTEARAALVDALGHEAMVDAAAVCANFQMATRVADGTGTPLDEASVDTSAAVRLQLALDQLASRRLP